MLPSHFQTTNIKMKYFFFLLVLCVFVENDVSAKKNHKKHHPKKSHGTKIVGGTEANIQDYPYQAYVLVRKGGDNAIECGGSIISEHYIITAAHCVADDDIAGVTARIGSAHKFEGGHEYSGTYEHHKDYVRNTLDFDIAYFKSDSAMDLDGVNAKAITMIEEGQSIPSGTILKVSGWGDTTEDGDDSDVLRAVEVPSVSNEECNANTEHNYGITDRQFCGGYKEGGKDQCEGDSGGPAVIKDSGVLVGVVSGGFGCARPDTPGIYVNITDPPIRSWIMQHTGV